MTSEATKAPSKSRLLTFDLLRGYFLLSIILNHLYWYPNGLDWVASRGELFVTAAEGFFLISGIILGIVRGSKLADKPFRLAAGLLLKRGVQLYITSIVLMLIFTILGWWFFMDNPGLKSGIRPINEPFWNVLAGAMSFQYIYGWADYLRLYSLFILISPVALWLLRRGKWYIVIASSILLWMLFPAAGTSPYPDELLMPIAWQVIFFSGFTIGFHWNDITRWWSSRSQKLRQTVMAIIVSTAAVTITANIVIYFGSGELGTVSNQFSSLFAVIDPYFKKESLPLARLILFAIWFIAGFWLFKRFEPFIVRYTGWILIPFGTNSLYVYTIHAFVIFFAHLIMLHASPNILINTIGTISVVAIIWLCVRYKVLMSIIPR